jgi:hypothetical protein
MPYAGSTTANLTTKPKLRISKNSPVLAGRLSFGGTARLGEAWHAAEWEDVGDGGRSERPCLAAGAADQPVKSQSEGQREGAKKGR